MFHPYSGNNGGQYSQIGNFQTSQFPSNTLIDLETCTSLNYSVESKDMQEIPCVLNLTGSIRFEEILPLSPTIGLLLGWTRSLENFQTIILTSFVVDSLGNRLGNPLIGLSPFSSNAKKVVYNQYLYTLGPYVYGGTANLNIFNITNFPGYFTDILGNASVGQTLNVGRIMNDPDGAPKSIGYQWERANFTDREFTSFFQKGTPIPNATNETY